MLELISDADKGNEPLDKLRIFIIWFLSTEQEVSRADMDKFEEALRNTGVDTTPLTYVRRYVTHFLIIPMLVADLLQCTRNYTHDYDLLRAYPTSPIISI